MVDLNYVVHGKGRKKCSRARVKAKTGQCSSDVGEEGVEEEVVAGEGDDLDIDDNEDEDEGALDEDEDDLDGSEGDLGESEDDIEAVDLDYEDGDYTSNEEDDANAVSGSDGEEEGTPKETGPSAQLVEVRDNIPDDEFEAMIRGESVPPQGEGHSMLEGGEEDTNLLVALILVPTRELALQVYAHIKDAAKFTDIRVGMMSSSDTHTHTHTHSTPRTHIRTMYTSYTQCTHINTSTHNHTRVMYTVTHTTHIHTHIHTHVQMHKIQQYDHTCIP